MKAATLADITITRWKGSHGYHLRCTGADSLMLSPSRSAQVFLAQDLASQTRDLTVSSVSYTELLGAWKCGTSATLASWSHPPQAFLIQTSQLTRVQMIINFSWQPPAGGNCRVVSVQPDYQTLTRLVQASTRMERGNLQVKVDSRAGMNEVAVLAQRFQQHGRRASEGFIYRDLLGRTVSPEVREQLRRHSPPATCGWKGRKQLPP
jgi:adenylate cyclase